MSADKNGKQLPKGIIQRADGRYMGRFTFNGERHTLYHDNSPKQLEKAMNNMHYELEHGIYGSLEKITLGKWFDIWLSDYKASSVKASTYNHFKTYYQLYIQKELSKRQLKDIKSIQIQRIYNDMVKRGLHTNTIKKVHNILNNMLGQAMKNDIILKNPCISVTIPRTENKERRVLSVTEQDAFLSHITKSSKWIGYQTLFVVALGTGLRIGELLALNWSDVDFNNKTISINKTIMYMQDQETKKCSFAVQPPKTKSSNRTIPLLDHVLFILKKHQKEQMKHVDKLGDRWEPLDIEGMRNLIFTTEFGRPLSGISVNRTISSIVRELKGQQVEIEDFAPHTLRHSFATRCFENGIPPKVVQEFLGHTSLNMTMDLYTHVMQETKAEEIKKLDNVFKMA